MNNDGKKTGSFDAIPDTALFEEVAARLRKLYQAQHRIDFLYGCFEFIFHEGTFQGIEDRPRYERYKSPARLSSVPV